MITRRMVTLAVPVLIIAIIALVVVLAPQEKTLGPGIKSVYVHVAFTWTGMLGLTLTGLLGVGALVTGRPRIQRWGQTLGWVAIALFATGLALSMLAAQINWGGIFWSEPRTTMALQIVSMALIVQILNSWIQPVRVKGVLHILAALFMTWRIMTTELILHPQSPILNSDSISIQLTFATLFLLVVTAAGWLVWRFLPRRRTAD
ncbi:MAG: hypothetical protein K8J31_00430 [Anaerolineae bacterium]|nr:hypothetical protein [Anaerolineae bacterium]